VPPFVDFLVDRDGMLSFWSLGNDDPRAALVHFLNDPVGVESLVGKDRVEIDAVDQGSHADCIVTLAGQEVKPHEVAKSIGQGKDFGRPTAFRLSDRLILSPPFAPCP